MTANALWCLGFPVQAVRRCQEALALAQELAHPLSLTSAQFWMAWLRYLRREAPVVQELAATLLTLATTQEFPLHMGHGTCWRGWALAMQGESAAGLVQLRQGMAAVLAAGQELARPLCLLLLAEATGQAGQVEDGLRLLDEALTVLEANGQGTCRRRHIAPGHCCCGRPSRMWPRQKLLAAGPGYCPPPAGQPGSCARP